jgi:DNA-binding response OmpR family regulator
MKILLIDALAKRLFCKNKTVSLTDKEFLLFEYLSSRREKNNIPVGKMINHVWQGRETAIGRLNISQLIFRLRRKLELLDSSAEITFSMSTGISFHFHEKCIVLPNGHVSRLLAMLIP